MACQDSGPGNPDIGGIGILVAFITQGFLSLVFSLWGFIHQRCIGRRFYFLEYGITHLKDDDIILNILAKILLNISDASTIVGIALVIAGIVQSSTLTLYQFRLLYDTVNMTGVANCAAFSVASTHVKPRTKARFVSITLFAILYLAFCIIFGLRLNQWDDNIPGFCYVATNLAVPDASHPYVDHMYLGWTCYWFFGVIYIAFIGEAIAGKTKANKRNAIQRIAWGALFYGMLQFPLHLYSIIALRTSNESGLTKGQSENYWGFGQVVAMVMIYNTLVDCCKGVKKYRDEIKRIRQEGENVNPVAASEGRSKAVQDTNDQDIEMMAARVSASSS